MAERWKKEKQCTCVQLRPETFFANYLEEVT